MPQFLANSFLGLNYFFSVQAKYIYLNLIDLSKKSIYISEKFEAIFVKFYLEIRHHVSPPAPYEVHKPPKKLYLLTQADTKMSY